jgi:integrase
VPRRLRGVKGRPWYREANDSFYVKVGGKQVRIFDEHGEPVRGPDTIDNRARAAKCWDRMQNAAHATERGNTNEVRLVFSRFLDHTETHHPGVYKNYRRALVSFADSLPSKEYAVGQLSAANVQAWWDAHPDWSDTTATSNFSIVSAALNWACQPENRLADFNPIKRMKKPRRRSRGKETLVSHEDHEAFLEHVPEDLRVVLFVLRETGTRPGNVTRVTAKDVDYENMVWVLEEHKTAEKTGETLIVPITREVAELCRGLAKEHPSGPLFRTASGEPWNSTKLANRVYYYHQKLKKVGAEVPERFFAYCYRHTRATELLEAGVSEAQVAAVLGHKGTKMLHHHYSHILGKKKLLAGVLEQYPTTRAGTGGTPASPPASASPGGAGEGASQRAG